MKAQVINQFGDPSVFSTVDIPKPVLQSGHILVRVAAASVNPIDCKIRSGKVPEISPVLPAVLHGDVSGIVEAVAPDVSTFQVGDEVYGFAGGVRGTGGALAEWMLADARLMAIRPNRVAIQEAAGFPLVSITAWKALFERAKLKENQSILIHGGAGGVGHVAVQLAKWKKAKVYATVRSEEDRILVQSLGTESVVNVNTESVEHYVQRLTEGKGFDVVFDTVGGENLDRSFQAVRIGGKVVTIAARSHHDLTPMHNKDITLHAVFTLNPLITSIGREFYGKILKKIAELINQGHLNLFIDKKIFSLWQANDAHAFFESGCSKGKIILID